jgi:transcriptional regulator with PAS, ATPase and Fis domain
MPGSFNLSFDHEPTMDEVKEALVTKVLAAHGGNKSKAARALGISERNMYRITSPGDDAK